MNGTQMFPRSQKKALMIEARLAKLPQSERIENSLSRVRRYISQMGMLESMGDVRLRTHNCNRRLEAELRRDGFFDAGNPERVEMIMRRSANESDYNKGMGKVVEVPELTAFSKLLARFSGKHGLENTKRCGRLFYQQDIVSETFFEKVLAQDNDVFNVYESNVWVKRELRNLTRIFAFLMDLRRDELSGLLEVMDVPRWPRFIGTGSRTLNFLEIIRTGSLPVFIDMFQERQAEQELREAQVRDRKERAKEIELLKAEFVKRVEGNEELQRLFRMIPEDYRAEHRPSEFQSRKVVLEDSELRDHLQSPVIGGELVRLCRMLLRIKEEKFLRSCIIPYTQAQRSLAIMRNARRFWEGKCSREELEAVFDALGSKLGLADSAQVEVLSDGMKQTIFNNALEERLRSVGYTVMLHKLRMAAAVRTRYKRLRSDIGSEA